MKNISMEIKKNSTKLTIEIDLDKEFGKSSSGKTTIIATTEGNISLPAPYEHIKLGVNVYKK